MPRKPREFRVERSHQRDCRDESYTTLAPDGDTVFCNRFANPRVTIGRWFLYIRVRCNDPRCHSTALVNLDAALRAVGLNFDA